MNETLEYIQTFARFPFALRKFLQHRLTLDDAKRIVRERMEHREENFLGIIEKSVYGYPRSPYLPLLKMAGCELGDLRALVKDKGVEGALRDLRAAGVYVTFEEFKGRKPIERSGLTLKVSARDFDNPFARRDFEVQTGGSTGLAMTVNQDLEHIADRIPHEFIALAAYSLVGAPTAIWSHILPGSTLRRIFQLATFGQFPRHWFSPTGWRDSKYWFKYDLALLYMLAWMRIAGIAVPFPEIVKLDQPHVIVRWLHETLKTNPRCLLFAGVSRAMRVCVAAAQAGLDLNGAVLRGGGEPVTAAKMQAIRNVGAQYFPTYAMSETGYTATGCVKPTVVDDMHLVRDAFAIFTYPHPVESLGITVPAFNLTTLLSTTPKLMLNVQMDDYGIVEERACGCELEQYGYSTHVHDIHSYSKLVSEGVTLIGSEMLRLLEELLPARFGGTPLDYQLMEEEDEQGLTRLYLIISPRVQILDEQQVIETFLRAMRESSPMADAARLVWQQTHTLRVKRQEPIPTARGKLLPLRIRQRIQPPTSQRKERQDE